MEWQRQTLVFRLDSGLHIGSGQLGFIGRTRWFVPAKNLWAMTTRVLTQQLYAGQSQISRRYAPVGAAIDRRLKFTNFYLWHDNRWYLPKYDADKGLLWGGTSEGEFAAAFLGSYLATALDMDSSAAAENTLHEMEYLLPQRQQLPVYLLGEVFYPPDATVNLPEQSLTVADILSRLTSSDDLYLGGESCYGYGRVTLLPEHEAAATRFDVISKIEEDSGEVYCYCEPGLPLPCFLKVDHQCDQSLAGDIELLVQREWEEKKAEQGAGQRLVCHGYYWLPGTICGDSTASRRWQIGAYGFWKKCPCRN